MHYFHMKQQFNWNKNVAINTSDTLNLWHQKWCSSIQMQMEAKDETF